MNISTTARWKAAELNRKAAEAAEDAARMSWPQLARERADALADGALMHEDGVPQCVCHSLDGWVPAEECSYSYWQRYRLRPDAPLPAVLHQRLAQAKFTPPEGPWPQFAATLSPIDWPALVRELPDLLAVVPCAGERNHPADAKAWAAVCDAYEAVAQAGHRPRLWVDLWASPADVVELTLNTLDIDVEVTTSAAPTADEETIAAVEAILTAGGFSSSGLHRYQQADPPDRWWLTR